MLTEGAIILSAFNLSCSVTSAVSQGERADDVKGLELSYRVDLNVERYCAGACAESRPIKSVSARELLLESNFAPDGSHLETIRINRESGMLVWVLGKAPDDFRAIGICEPTPFTGLPRPKF